jgi:hypothetical protein
MRLSWGGGGDNPFVGTWTGIVSFSGLSGNATIEFTATEWTLVCGGLYLNETGTYTLADSSTASLLQSSNPFGNVLISNGTLMGSIIAGSYNGAFLASFTK